MTGMNLETYAELNPHKSRFSQMEHPDLTAIVKEAVDGIKKGIEPTIAARWLVEVSPIELTIKHDTIRQWLFDKARN